MSSYTVKVYEMAKFMYERREALSVEEGWPKLDTEFDALPEEQIRIWIGLAGSTIGYIKNDLEKASRIIT